jgi:hypothetical protein
MSRDELERIQWGPEPGQALGGLGSVRIVTHCQAGAENVLNRAKRVLEIMCAGAPVSSASPEQWSRRLPEWFVKQLAPEPSDAEVAKYLSLPYEERMKAKDDPWTLSAWLYWFQPENRYWFWWDGVAADEKTLIVAIEVTEWPFPWGALKWLLKAAGAISVEAES